MDRLTKNDLEPLVGSTFLTSFELHEELASTNDRAKQLVREIAPALPCLVVANRQTAGRGRSSHRWLSSDGSLTFSIIVPQERPFGAPDSTVSLWSAIAMCRAVQLFVSSSVCRVKWPNDLFLAGRKVGGLLLESLQASTIIGVGINVANELDSVMLPDATSIMRESSASSSPSLASVLRTCVESWDVTRRQSQEAAIELPTIWRGLDELRDVEVVVETGANRLRGIAQGINADGALRLRTNDEIRLVVTGSVRKVDASIE